MNPNPTPLCIQLPDHSVFTCLLEHSLLKNRTTLTLRQFQLLDPLGHSVTNYNLYLSPSVQAASDSTVLWLKTDGSPWMLVHSTTISSPVYLTKDTAFPYHASGIGSSCLTYRSNQDAAHRANLPPFETHQCFLTSNPHQLCLSYRTTLLNADCASSSGGNADGDAGSDDSSHFTCDFDCAASTLCISDSLLHLTCRLKLKLSYHGLLSQPSPTVYGCVSFYHLHRLYTRQYSLHKHNLFHRLKFIQYQDQIYDLKALPCQIQGRLGSYNFYPRYVIVTPKPLPSTSERRKRYRPCADLFLLLCEHDSKFKPVYLHFS